MRDTQVAVSIALNTIEEISPLLEGHIEALRKEKSLLTNYPVAGKNNDDEVNKYSHRPPIIIPSELKLAKPQRE